MESDAGAKLVEELLADPEGFDKDGRAYQLLQCYFDGFPLETLRPLLRSREHFVQKAAAFIVAELGGVSRALLADIVPLMETGDRYLKYQAMEAITVCADGTDAELFMHVPMELTGDDEVLRRLAMRLMASADCSQLAAAARALGEGHPDSSHGKGLSALAEDALSPAIVMALLDDADPLARRYGAIAAKRMEKAKPGSATAAAARASDPELLDYLREP